jgi:alkylation response protein AidB-like acyl-CoA dehydrogenase
VHAAGLATARIATAAEVLVVCNAASGVRAVIVPASFVDARPVHGIDPDAGFHTVRVEHRPAGGEPSPVASWESAVALGRRAVAHEMLGASRTMLERAREHALERNQFGRPIASFQAVRHRLADALVAVESLEATLRAAGDEPDALTAALAKATAGRTARTVTTNCQQVLAGIGFTTDHPFHRFLKRTMLLDGLFGSADEIAVNLGRHLLAERRVPTLIEL